MTTALATLNPAAQVALANCEQRIERGLKTFIDVGQALAEIRDSRLYKGSHETFEAYCQERWGFTDRRARQIMEAAEIGTMVPVENERQARALASVPESERADVLREAAERANGKATAKAISEVAKERTAPAEPEHPPTPGPVDAAVRPPADPGATPAPVVDNSTAASAAPPREPATPPPPGSPATWTDEQREANQREIDRKRMVADGQKAAQSLVMSVRAEISTVVKAIDLGEKNLINPQMIADLRRAIDLLESRMEASR